MKKFGLERDKDLKHESNIGYKVVRSGSFIVNMDRGYLASEEVFGFLRKLNKNWNNEGDCTL